MTNEWMNESTNQSIISIYHINLIYRSCISIYHINISYQNIISIYHINQSINQPIKSINQSIDQLEEHELQAHYQDPLRANKVFRDFSEGNSRLFQEFSGVNFPLNNKFPFSLKRIFFDQLLERGIIFR